MTIDILFSDITAVMPNDKGVTVEKNMYISVKDGKISYVGKTKPKGSPGRVVNGRNKVIMPGLINTHTHLPMTLLRGYADDSDLQTWLFDNIFPMEKKFDAYMIGIGARIGIAEAISSGTTSVTDMYFFIPEIAKEIYECGIKGNISNGVTCFSPEYDINKDKAIRETEAALKDWKNEKSGRIKVDTGIHAEYTSNPDVWKKVSDFAKENGTGIHVHMSETRREHKECIEKYGKTPAELFLETGVFDVRTTAAHCVWVDDRDIEIMRKMGVTAAHNPISNLKLASGVADIRKLIDAGVNVTIGTDGASSNNNLDLFEELKCTGVLHKGISLNPVENNACEVIKLATYNGAFSQGREKECGQIKSGFDADLIVLDFSSPNLTPCHNILSGIVYSAKGYNVCMNMVQGKILYENGEFKTIDFEKLRTEYEKNIAAKLF